MKAVVVEKHRWMLGALTTFVLVTDDGIRLPGQITVQNRYVEKSIDDELVRYSTMYYTASVDEKARVLTQKFEPFAVIDHVEAKRALLEAYSQIQKT